MTLSHQRVDKAFNKPISEAYTEYKQHELNKKGKKTGKVLGEHVIGLCLTGISQEVKTRDVQKLTQDTKIDLSISD